jgi:hypothetical protein
MEELWDSYVTLGKKNLNSMLSSLISWVPISAKIVKGKRVTSFFAIKDDLINAGGN